MRTPHLHHLATTAFLLATCVPALAEQVGEVDVDWFGNDIIVEALADPDVLGVTCHIAYFERGMIDRLQHGNWFEDPSNSSIACRQTGPITIGNPNGAAPLRRAGKGNVASVQAMQKRADARATDLADVLEDLEQKGFTTLQAQANELNRRGIKTARGGRWHASSVSNLRRRLAQAA